MIASRINSRINKSINRAVNRSSGSSLVNNRGQAKSIAQQAAERRIAAAKQREAERLERERIERERKAKEARERRLKEEAEMKAKQEKAMADLKQATTKYRDSALQKIKEWQVANIQRSRELTAAYNQTGNWSANKKGNSTLIYAIAAIGIFFLLRK